MKNVRDRWHISSLVKHINLHTGLMKKLEYFFPLHCFLFIYLFWEREREREREREHTREKVSMRISRGRGRERIPSRLSAVNTEPNAGLGLRNLFVCHHDPSQKPKSRVGRLSDWAIQAPLPLHCLGPLVPTNTIPCF